MFYCFIHFLKIASRVGVILMAMMIATASQAIDIFVDQNKSSGVSGNGRDDWSQAFITLEEAIAVIPTLPPGSHQIFVAEGTYTPNDFFDTGDRTQTYLIDENIVILGGYKGEDEASSMQRDPATFLTILSGDFKNPVDAPFSFVREYLTDASRIDNAFTVVTVLGVTRDNPGTRLEGFIIQGGNQGTYTGDEGTGFRGGGMLIDNSAMDIVNCTFRFNATGVPPNSEFPFGVTSDGGGASVRGGQLLISGDPDYTRFINCTFHDNFSARGGGLAVVDGSPEDSNVKLINCRFYNNQAIELSTATLKPGDDNDRLVQLPIEGQSP